MPAGADSSSRFSAESRSAFVRTDRIGARGGGAQARRVPEGLRFALGGFDEVEDHVGVMQCVEGGGAHDLLQGDGGFEESRRVDEHDLGVAEGQDAGDAVARGLGARAGDGEFLSDEPVEERGLADVRLADDGDETGSVTLLVRGQMRESVSHNSVLYRGSQSMIWHATCSNCSLTASLRSRLLRCTRSVHV